MAIVIADQFNLEVNKSIDDRLIVADTATLYSKFNNLNSYIGMLVYVEANKTYYSLNKYLSNGNADSTCWVKVADTSSSSSASHASTADKATNDASNQNIANTYIKNVGLVNNAVSGVNHKRIELTKGNNAKSTVDIPTFTTTDDGLVPAPTSTNTSKFLRGDGTWQVPTDNKVGHNLNTNTTFYITGTNNSSSSTAGDYFNTNHHINGDYFYTKNIEVSNAISQPSGLNNLNIYFDGLKDSTNQSKYLTEGIIIGNKYNSESNSFKNEQVKNAVVESWKKSWSYTIAYPETYFSTDIAGGTISENTGSTGIVELDRNWSIYNDGVATFSDIVIGNKIAENGMNGSSMIISKGLIHDDYGSGLHISSSIDVYGSEHIALVTKAITGDGCTRLDELETDPDINYIYLSTHDAIHIKSQEGGYVKVGDNVELSTNVYGYIDFNAANGIRSYGPEITADASNRITYKVNATTVFEANSTRTKLRAADETNLTVNKGNIKVESPIFYLSPKPSSDVVSNDNVVFVFDRQNARSGAANYKFVSSGGNFALKLDMDTNLDQKIYDVDHTSTGNFKFYRNVQATKFIGALQGNATTATTLQNARTINGTSFNGSDNIITANWGTARTITIGNTGKSVNGSGNVSWTLSEIGAATTAQGTKADNAMPRSGGTFTGAVTFANNTLNPLSDNVAIGDQNINGTLVIKGLNGKTTIKLDPHSSSGTTPNTLVAEGDGTLTVSGTIASTFKGNLTGNASTATKLAAPKTIGLSGAVTSTATNFDGSANISIPVNTLDATKLTGMVPLSSIPKGALERMVRVANKAARLALTSSQVQIGDTVKEEDTGMMYYVVDASKLSTEDGYEVYTAGSASSVPWGGVTGKPSTFNPSAHNQAISTITGIQTLSIQLNGGTAQTYTPSKALSLNITPASIGASATSHTHSYLPLSGGTLTGALNITTSNSTMTINGTTISGSSSSVVKVGNVEASAALKSNTIAPLSGSNIRMNGNIESTYNIKGNNITATGKITGNIETKNLIDCDEELIIFGGTATS